MSRVPASTPQPRRGLPRPAARSVSAGGRRARAGLVAVLVLAASTAGAAAQGGSGPAEGATVRARDGGPIYVPYPYFVGPCGAYGLCAPGWWFDRTPPRRPVAPDPPKPVDTDLWGGTGSPWGYVRRLPPPTPESQIQPRYREASTLRPQFAESGTAPTR
jgi:hypothetical protein